jgi:hypothetical protein
LHAGDVRQFVVNKKKKKKETDLIQDGGQIKRQKDIDHHSPKYTAIICHLRDPPHFSLVPTFNDLNSHLFPTEAKIIIILKKWL